MQPELISFLENRRSVKAPMLGEPGPSPAQLEQILKIAARVPDHKKLAPWRFIVFEGDARRRIGEVFASACLDEDDASASEIRLKTERDRFMRAPVVVAVISSPIPHAAVPVTEQILSAGAVGLNTCLAANASGFGTQWLTEWIAYSPRVAAAMALKESEKVAAFIYIGTARETQEERERPDMAKIVSYF